MQLTNNVLFAYPHTSQHTSE